MINTTHFYILYFDFPDDEIVMMKLTGDRQGHKDTVNHVDQAGDQFCIGTAVLC